MYDTWLYLQVSRIQW